MTPTGVKPACTNLNELSDLRTDEHNEACETIPRPVSLHPLKYPLHSTVEKLTSTLEIKQWWLFNEWDPRCQFSGFIRPTFPKQATLHPETGNAKKELVESVFHNVRGQYRLWGEDREKGRWKKVVANPLQLEWIKTAVEVLFPTQDRFETNEMNGLVLWKDPKERKYTLLEGNHRISAWRNRNAPEACKSTFYIGKPAK